MTINDNNPELRKLGAEAAEQLKPGEQHYRAFVGPPRRYDFLSASQFALLFLLGMDEKSKILDFGCGSLRLGRLLIPFLRAENYFGIDPNKWLIDDGVAMELGQDAVNLKQPKFEFNDDFDCTIFDTRFDFIMAQSILTHTGPDSAEKLLSSTRKALTSHGVFLASLKLIEDRECALPENGWHYPYNVNYGAKHISSMMDNAGLFWRKIGWHHPGAVWIVASKSQDRVTEVAALSGLSAKPIGT